MNAGRAFALAWRWVRRLPGPLARGLFDVAGLTAWLLHGTGVRQLEANLARVRPAATPREVRRLSRDGMRAYMRYYCEAFQLPAWTPDHVVAHVRVVGDEECRADLAAGRAVVFALGHMGNWDLAGAWAGRNLARLVAVVERLEPEELFREFLEFRERIGMTVIPFERGGSVLRRLVQEARSAPQVVVLLADRDLTETGVQVDLFGEPARVAAGPAALALAAGIRVHPVRIWHERLTGERRRRARGPWGIVIDFAPPIVADRGAPREEEVRRVTQAWVDALAAGIAAHPADWHMLQKVFVADTDPERLPPPGGRAGS